VAENENALLSREDVDCDVSIPLLTEGTSEVKACHSIVPVFDDSNLVSAAGLVPVLELARRAGLEGLLAEHVSVASANPVAKSRSVLAGMLAGADSIEDLDLLRAGAMARVVGGVRAPSTLGTFLRTFTHGHVQQVDKVSAGLLAGLTAQVPGLLAGGRDEQGMVFVDIDDTIRAVHGYAKQAAGFGYTRVRGLNIQLATASTPISAPVVVRARLRRGNIASHTGAPRLVAQAITTVRAAGAAGQVLVRADSAYYTRAFIAAAVRAGAWFSVTARMNPKVVAAIASIDDDAWTPIAYPQAVRDDQAGGWVSDAQVAEVPFTAFTSLPTAQQVTCRLVVRRVKRLQPRASDGSVQGELFADWRHHAFVTNSSMTTVEADARHRDHAIVEQVIAELKDGPLAHLPSGSYAANAAWVAFTALAFNLARAAAIAAGMATARWATLRRRLITMPARLATTGRRLVLHLPEHWPWATAWIALWDAITTTEPPPSATT
jgi:Transposase DDE domain group 1